MENKRIKRFVAAGVAVAAALMVMIIGACNQPDVGSTDTVGGSNLTNNSSSGGGMIPTRDICMDGKDNDFDFMVDRYGLPPHCTIGEVATLTALGTVGKFYAVGFYDVIEPDVYTVLVTTGGGSGAAQIIVSSRNGDVVGPGLSGPLTVFNGIPLLIGTHGVKLYFMDTLGTLNLALGESWTFSLSRWTNCIAPPEPGCDHPGAVYEFGCANGVDDNGDGLVDGFDPTCYRPCDGAYNPDWDFEGTAQPPAQCSDGFDNNVDGFTDIGDLTCHVGCLLAGAYMPCWNHEGTCPP